MTFCEMTVYEQYVFDTVLHIHKNFEAIPKLSDTHLIQAFKKSKYFNKFVEYNL